MILKIHKPGKPSREALRFKNFCEEVLVHTKGEWANRPFHLEAWQWKDIIAPLFGTMNPNGTRQYRTAYISLARKNGKSELAAAVALYMLLMDGEQGGEVYGAASDRDQASLVFNVAADMVRRSPALTLRCDLVPSTKRIIDRKTGSTYRAGEGHSGPGNPPRRTPDPSLEHIERGCKAGCGRKHETRQIEIIGQNRRGGRHDHGLGPGHGPAARGVDPLGL